jgi:fluoroquinolone transport system ATP-binding protein
MIEVQDLVYRYPSSPDTALPAVNKISFHIDQGEIFGFLGPSGAGKSTTQKLLIGLLKGYEGKATLFGNDVSAWGREIYEKIGVGFELPNHYLKLTGKENLKHFASLYSGDTESPDKLLDMVGLGDDADKLVSGYSKGMKVRLNFARALVHKPDLIFFDEPTSGLDPVNAKRVKDIILAQKAAGKTVFLTTHNMGVADDLCDRLAFIIDGAVTTIDSPENLKRAYGERKISVTHGQNGSEATAEFSLDDLGNNSDFLTLLKSNYIQSIHTQEATLEKIFIQVNGRSLV